MSIGVLSAGSTSIVFEVSADKMLTWQEARRSGAARWVTHDVFAGKPKKEFIGPGLDKVDLVVRLDINIGVVPRDELRRMREQRDLGNVLQFTVGGEFVGDFSIENLAEGWKHVSRTGVLTVAEVSLALEEYA